LIPAPQDARGLSYDRYFSLPSQDLGIGFFTPKLPDIPIGDSADCFGPLRCCDEVFIVMGSNISGAVPELPDMVVIHFEWDLAVQGQLGRLRDGYVSRLRQIIEIR